MAMMHRRLANTVRKLSSHAGSEVELVVEADSSWSKVWAALLLFQLLAIGGDDLDL